MQKINVRGPIFTYFINSAICVKSKQIMSTCYAMIMYFIPVDMFAKGYYLQ